MSQQRLERYFNTTRPPFVPSRCSFLHLPYHVRRLVYEYIAFDCCLIDLNYHNLVAYPPGEYPETLGCRKLETSGIYELRRNDDIACLDEVWEMFPEQDEDKFGISIWNRPWGGVQAMLLVSKLLHAEIESYIYSTATFRACLGHPLGFSRLWRMSENALSHLQKLTIRLNQPMSEVYHDDWGWMPRVPKFIDLSNAWGKAILRSWLQTLDLLARTLTSRTLRLNLSFRAQTMDDARAILEPLERLPLLKGCGIFAEVYGQDCFWEKRKLLHSTFSPWELVRPESVETELSLLTQHIIERLTASKSTTSAPFRYLDLPQEIRLAILRYTNLVSPDPVQWRPNTALVRNLPCSYCDDYGEPIMINNSDRCCQPHRISYVEVESTTRYPCCEKCAHDDRSAICYCCRRAPVWSSSCICSQSRGQALFWVSRQVRWDAQVVYYNNNKVLVTSYNTPPLQHWNFDDHDDWGSLNSPTGLSKVELSLYLSSISGHALYHIHWLEWILPRANRSYLMPGTRAWHDFLDTILLMENGMNLTALTLTINMSLSRCRETDKSSWTWWEMVVVPFRRLGHAGLKDFFVNLRRGGIENARRAHHERDLEKAVMGKEYDSRKSSKEGERIYDICRENQERNAL